MLVILYRHLNIFVCLLFIFSGISCKVCRIVLRWHLLRKLSRGEHGSRTQVPLMISLILTDALDHGNGCFLHVVASLLVMEFICLIASLKRCSLTALNTSLLSITLDNVGHVLVGFILHLFVVGRRLKECLITDECRGRELRLVKSLSRLSYDLILAIDDTWGHFLRANCWKRGWLQDLHIILLLMLPTVVSEVGNFVLSHHICGCRFHFLSLSVIVIAVALVADKCLAWKTLRLQQQRLVCVESIVVNIVTLGLVRPNASFEAFFLWVDERLLDHFGWVGFSLHASFLNYLVRVQWCPWVKVGCWWA